MKKLIIKRGDNSHKIIYNGPNMIREIEMNGNKFYEYTMLEYMADLPYRRGLWLDIGANVGNHTIFFSRYCKADEVWSYEPNAGSFDILKKNVKENTKRTVRLFNCAIGDKKGKCKISDNENPGINKVLPGKGSVTMETITPVARVALMKIDVEGYEKKVIKGAIGTIERDKPYLFIETHGDYEDILKLLPDGYKMIKRFNNAPTYFFEYNAD